MSRYEELRNKLGSLRRRVREGEQPDESVEIADSGSQRPDLSSVAHIKIRVVGEDRDEPDSLVVNPPDPTEIRERAHEMRSRLEPGIVAEPSPGNEESSSDSRADFATAHHSIDDKESHFGEITERLNHQINLFATLEKHAAAQSVESIGSVRAIKQANSLLAIAKHSIGIKTEYSQSPKFNHALEVLSDIVDGIAAPLTSTVAQYDKREEQVKSLSELLAAVSDGGAIDVALLDSLGAEIIDEVTKRGYPRLLFEKRTSPADRISEHALNSAQVLAFLLLHPQIDEVEADRIVAASLLRDVGMLRLPQALLDKPGPLSVDERKTMEQHIDLAREVADSQTDWPALLIDAVCGHHDRHDGSGYPNRPAETAPTRVSCALVCADLYAGQQSRRSYRAAKTAKAAMLTVLAEADAGRIDPQIAQVLLQLSFFPVGTSVELATGEEAVVVAPQTTGSNLQAASQPIVRIITDSQGTPVNETLIWNLAQKTESRIVRDLSSQIDSLTQSESDAA